MMSILLRNKENGKTVLFIKGADGSVIPLLESRNANDLKTLDYVDEFASLGYRTLVFAMREIQDLELE